MTATTIPSPTRLAESGPAARSRAIPHVACIGGAHIEIKARASGPVTLATSNPVSSTETVGGAARNVAETLARLGCFVSLVTRVGTGARSETLLRGLLDVGIDTRFVSQSDMCHTATYTAVLDTDGGLVLGLANMDIYEEVTADLVSGVPEGLAHADVWFLDCNLPATTLNHLLEARPSTTLVMVDAVSEVKSARLRGHLDKIDVLFADKNEASHLSGIPVRRPLDVCEAAHRLRAQGVGATVIALGEDGGFVASDRTYDFFPAFAARMLDRTGMGDAMAAGVVWGQAWGRPLAEAARLGLAGAAMAAETTAAVPEDITEDALLARAGLKG